MSRYRVSTLLLLAGTASGAVWAADLTPQDFAYGMAITTPAPAEAYRLTIPFEVYTKIAHDDLRDLRVFNARGELVPYELQPAPDKPATGLAGPALPLFPLPADAHATLDGVRITVQSQGTALELRAPRAAPSAPPTITSYVLDGRNIKTPISGLELHWPEQAPEYSGHIQIESSNDLGSWRVVKADEPVMNLHITDAALVQGRLSFTPAEAKFWRLTWRGKAAPFELTSVTAVAPGSERRDATSTITVGGSAVHDKSGGVAFDLGASLPVTQVSVTLPEANSVLNLELLSRRRVTDSWRPVTTGEFYRVRQDSTERSNPPIAIAPDTDRFWLARATSSAAIPGDIRLQEGWRTMDVVFLARGGGPYQLAYGNASVAGSGVNLAPLLTGVPVQTAQLGEPHPLGGAARLISPRTIPWKMAILWGVLGLGAALLAGMAYRLSRELRPAKSGEP